MTLATIEKKLKKYQEIESRLYRILVTHLPARPITGKRMHTIYSEVMDMLADLLAEKKISKQDRKAVETYFGSASHFIAEYEQKTLPMGKSTPEEILKFFIEQHDLNQSSLSNELGGQPVVSEILRGRRKLNRDQIERLSRKFGVSPATFYSARMI